MHYSNRYLLSLCLGSTLLLQIAANAIPSHDALTKRELCPSGDCNQLVSRAPETDCSEDSGTDPAYSSMDDERIEARGAKCVTMKKGGGNAKYAGRQWKKGYHLATWKEVSFDEACTGGRKDVKILPQVLKEAGVKETTKFYSAEIESIKNRGIFVWEGFVSADGKVLISSEKKGENDHTSEENKMPQAMYLYQMLKEKVKELPKIFVQQTIDNKDTRRILLEINPSDKKGIIEKGSEASKLIAGTVNGAPTYQFVKLNPEYEHEDIVQTLTFNDGGRETLIFSTIDIKVGAGWGKVTKKEKEAAPPASNQATNFKS